MTTGEAINVLRELISQIPQVRAAGRFSGLHMRWFQNTLFEVARIFGPKSGVLSNLQQLTWSPPSGTMIPGLAWELNKNIEALGNVHFEKDLERAQGILESVIDQLQRVGIEGLRREEGYLIGSGARKVFISHGHAEEILRRVEDFLRALGTEPIVVKREASAGAAVDDLVEQRMEECDAVVVLATADDQVEQQWQPRGNVIHEIGLAQRIHPDRIIYLKEEGCDFPSNISPKVWESFTRANLEPAFQKIATELRQFGLLGL